MSAENSCWSTGLPRDGSANPEIGQNFCRLLVWLSLPELNFSKWWWREVQESWRWHKKKCLERFAKLPGFSCIYIPALHWGPCLARRTNIPWVCLCVDWKEHPHCLLPKAKQKAVIRYNMYIDQIMLFLLFCVNEEVDVGCLGALTLIFFFFFFFLNFKRAFFFFRKSAWKGSALKQKLKGQLAILHLEFRL